MNSCFDYLSLFMKALKYIFIVVIDYSIVINRQPMHLSRAWL
ncbi:hypothetical protein DJ66_0804 [Candidatus Liberibacter solanacearum]|uniref:Uncharacterized protein n=1 Tax=Candidatus Liberibacter solanacearum TaxID=556287 RepID=A0A0F4VLB8_9HYPH|nr:hypothetical protein DJ66_0804 [Candidatus Liberibacter solanacearum]